MQSQAFNIVLPVPLVRRVDQVAKQQYKNRSEFIRETLLRRLEDLEDWQRIFAWGKKVGKKLGIKNQADADKIFFEYRHGKSKKR